MRERTSTITQVATSIAAVVTAIALVIIAAMLIDVRDEARRQTFLQRQQVECLNGIEKAVSTAGLPGRCSPPPVPGFDPTE